MKARLSCLLAAMLMLLSLALPAAALDQPEQLTAPPPPGPAGPDQKVAPPPAPPKEEHRPPGERPPRRDRGRREDMDHEMQPDVPPGRFALPPAEPLIRMLMQRRPELAARLLRLRQLDPDLFQRVVTDAFAIRLEEVLEQAEADFRHHMRREGGDPGSPREQFGPLRGPNPPEPPREPEFERRVRELHQRHEQLELRSQETAERLHVLRREGAPGAEQERLRDELAATVNEHFDVRSELRQLELGQIERELHRLRERIEKMRAEFERRQHERGAIVERRVHQLLGDDFGGW